MLFPFRESFVDEARRSLLVVDDEEPIRLLLQQHFEEQGYQVHLAACGEEALALIEQQPLGTAIIDKNLATEMNGLQVLQCLRDRSPFTRAVMITAQGTLDSAVEALRCGAHDYVTKPFDLALLTAKVDEARGAFVRQVNQMADLTRHQFLFETIPGLVWFITEQGHFTRVNRCGARLLGYEPEDLLNQSFELLLDRDQDQAVQWAFKERRTGDRATRRVVVRLRGKDGQVRLFEVYSSGAYLIEPESTDRDRNYWGTVGVAHDITERVKLQESLFNAQKMEALGRLAGGVAHDINNLLSVVLFGIDLFKEALPQGHELRPELAGMEQASLQGSRLVEVLLSFSRSRPRADGSFDVVAAVRAMRDVLARLMPKGVSLALALPEGALPISGDPSLLEQIVLNLAVNAGDASAAGSTVSVALEGVSLPATGPASLAEPPELAPGSYARLTVRDTGRGMSPEVRQHLFEPFFTTKPAGAGTGFGLSIVYYNVRHLRGVVTVDTAPGAGSTFSVWLPCDQPQAGATPQPAPAPRRAVLLVEDDDLLRAIVRRALEAGGYEVFDAGSGEAALALWGEQQAHVIALLTDVMMPGMDGPALARQLRGARPDLPVVFVTGHERARPADLGADQPRTALLMKPFGNDGLLAALSQVLAPEQG